MHAKRILKLAVNRKRESVADDRRCRMEHNFPHENDHGDVVPVGFPYDEGVRRNNEKVRAKFGPKSFRD